MQALKASRSTCRRVSLFSAASVRPGRRQAQSASEKPFHPLYGAMQGLIRIMPGTDLTQPADPEWADRLDAEYGPEKREK